MLISITASSIKTITNYQNKTEFEAMGNEIMKRCPHCRVSFVSDGGCPAMWCSRCQKKFCQLCLKPVNTFIPVKMHIAFGQCTGKESSKDEILSMLVIIWTIISLLILTCYIALVFARLLSLFVSIFSDTANYLLLQLA